MARCSGSDVTVSVVIPTIGREQLRESLESVARQSRPANEVIVVDNGSDRMAVETMVKSALPSSSVLSIPPRSGPSAARNAGALSASGEYIAFLDDDDQFDLDYLRHVCSDLRKTSPILLYTTIVRFSTDRRELYIKQLDALMDPSELARRFYMHVNPGAGGSNLVVRREEFLNWGGFDCGLRTCEDRELALRFLLRGCAIETSRARVLCFDHAGYRAKFDRSKVLARLRISARYRYAFRLEDRVRSVAAVVRLGIRDYLIRKAVQRQR